MKNLFQIGQEISTIIGFDIERKPNSISNPKEKNDNMTDQLGHSDITKDKLEKAINLTKQGLKISPKNEILWATLGYFYYHKQDFQRSIKCFLKTIQINPKNIDNWIDLSFAYRAYGDFKTSDYLFENYEGLINKR